MHVTRGETTVSVYCLDGWDKTSDWTDIYTILRYITSRKLDTVIIVTSYIHTYTHRYIGRRDIQVVPRNPIYWQPRPVADTALGVLYTLESGMHGMRSRQLLGWSAFCRSVCLSIYLTLRRGWRRRTLKRLYPRGNPNPSSIPFTVKTVI